MTTNESDELLARADDARHNVVHLAKHPGALEGIITDLRTEVERLQARIAGGESVTHRLLGDWFINGQSPDYPELWVSAAALTRHDHITDAERDWLLALIAPTPTETET